MCERCEAAKQRLTVEEGEELDRINEQINQLHEQRSRLCGNLPDEEMARRFVQTCERLDATLLAFAKQQTEQGLFGAEAQERTRLFVPALMLMACRLALTAGFDIEDTVALFGSELQQALVQRGTELAQQFRYLTSPKRGGNGVVH